MKIFKFKDLKSTMSFYGHCSFTYLCNTHLVQLHDGIHNTAVVINALQNLQSAISRAVFHIARPSVRLSPLVRPSVTRVDQSKTVGEDYVIFTVQYTSSSCGIRFIQKFWRITLSGGIKQGWGWKRAIFYSFMRRYLGKIQD